MFAVLYGTVDCASVPTAPNDSKFLTTLTPIIAFLDTFWNALFEGDEGDECVKVLIVSIVFIPCRGPARRATVSRSFIKTEKRHHEQNKIYAFHQHDKMVNVGQHESP